MEVDPPGELPGGEVVVLQPYGSLFFAAAPGLRGRPAGGGRDGPGGSVVILRLRGRTDLGTTFMDVLHRYAVSLRDAGSKLVIVSANERILEQLEVTGTVEVIGPANVYMGDERVGAAVQRAYEDALVWVASARTAERRSQAMRRRAEGDVGVRSNNRSKKIGWKKVNESGTSFDTSGRRTSRTTETRAIHAGNT